jgi:hypothetical protein
MIAMMTNDEWYVSLGRERCRRQRHGEGDDNSKIIKVEGGGGWWVVVVGVEFDRSSWRETLFKLNSPSRLGGKLQETTPPRRPRLLFYGQISNRLFKMTMAAFM